MFVSTFLPTTNAKIGKSGTISLGLKNGVINTTTIVSGGSGYTAAPVVSATDSGTPSGFTAASFTATLTNGSVSAIAINSGGKDYNVPNLTIAAPTAITFDGSDDEVLGTGIVNINDDTIKLTSAQQAALPVNAVVTYNSGGGTSIGGLTSGTQYKIHTSGSNKIKLKTMSGSSAINITSVGTGNSHTFTGTTATGTATSQNGVLESVSIQEPGFGYIGAPTITFSGTAISGLSGTAPSVTIGIDSKGRLDKDAITINSNGSNWSNLFGSVQANPNAGKVVEIEIFGKANKIYKTAPTIIFPAPESRDADGNLLSTNVTAVANFTLDSEGEISGVNISNVGNGYITDPQIKLGSGSNIFMEKS